MNDTPIVYIIDDNLGMRKSLRYLFESAGMNVETYEAGELFLDDFDPLQPGCMVLDLRMPEMSGIGVLERLRDQKSNIPAIVISGHADVISAITIMKLGAVDLLQKPFEPLDLLAAVRGAIAKSVESLPHKLMQDKWSLVIKDLTPREREMLKLIVGGRSNKQIAVDMGIAFKTVVNHRAHLMAKTRATNAADLARMSTMAGMV